VTFFVPRLQFDYITAALPVELIVVIYSQFATSPSKAPFYLTFPRLRDWQLLSLNRLREAPKKDLQSLPTEIPSFSKFCKISVIRI
jgi:hypothetical protein